MAELVAYYRVSTQRQGRSGLGLEAQREAVSAYAKRVGAIVFAEYTEIESGRKCNRPKLIEALGIARLRRATIVVARLDRLARNLSFLTSLIDAGVEFKAVDMPEANRLIIQILGAIAEYESKLIGERVKAALAAYKARGGHFRPKKPKSRKAIEHHNRHLRRVSSLGHDAYRTALKNYRSLMVPVVLQYRSGRSLAATAVSLNEAGYVTFRGRPWTAATVSQTLIASTKE